MNATDGARVRILGAAERLFAEHGFDATPTSSIAKLAEVPKGLLFYYFPTKSDVLRALVSERLDMGPIDTIELSEPGDPAQALINLATKLSEIESASPVLRVIVWREQRTHPEVRVKLHEHRLNVQGVVERVLRASLRGPVAAGTIRAAAAAWVAILAMRPFADHGDAATDDPTTDLPALARLICGGLGGAAPA